MKKKKDLKPFIDFMFWTMIGVIMILGSTATMFQHPELLEETQFNVLFIVIGLVFGIFACHAGLMYLEE